MIGDRRKSASFRAQLRIEALESKTLLSAAACTFTHGVINLSCSPADDALLVMRDTPSQTIQIAINGKVSYAYPAADVRELVIQGLEGNDTAFLEPDLNLPLTVLHPGQQPERTLVSFDPTHTLYYAVTAHSCYQRFISHGDAEISPFLRSESPVSADPSTPAGFNYSSAVTILGHHLIGGSGFSDGGALIGNGSSAIGLPMQSMEQSAPSLMLAHNVQKAASTGHGDELGVGRPVAKYKIHKPGCG